MSRPLAAKRVAKCRVRVRGSVRAAEFVGASEDGSRVFFTTAQPLVPGDTDTSNNLYMARIGCPAVNRRGVRSREAVK